MITRTPWLWPAIIVSSAVGASLVTFLTGWTALRVPVSLWFLGVCTGMAYVGLLRLNEKLTEWVLAIALSLSLAALVAGIMLYAGAWSPERGLIVLVIISLAGALLQLGLSYGQKVGMFIRTFIRELISAPVELAGRFVASLRSASGFLEIFILLFILFCFGFIAFISSLALGLLAYISFVVFTRVL